MIDRGIESHCRHLISYLRRKSGPAFFITLFALVIAAPVRAAEKYGSGFLIQSNGYIVTNHHVISDSNKIEVTVPDHGSFTATLVSDNADRDLALLKIAGQDLPVVAVGQSSKVNVLDSVTVLGYPLPTALGTGVSAYRGTLNALRTEKGKSYLQIDATVNQGNSGGPVLNDRGEVVGIIVSTLNTLNYIANGENAPERIHYAIPVDDAVNILQEAFSNRFTASVRTTNLTPVQIYNEAKPATVQIKSTQSGSLNSGGAITSATPGFGSRPGIRSGFAPGAPFGGPRFGPGMQGPPPFGPSPR